MKKRTCTFLLALLAALTLTVPAWAETQPGDALIYDTESLLTDGERQQLESLADQITWQYDCAVYVVTIYDYEQYADGVYEAAYTIYNDYDFGIGEGRDGVLLLLSMYDRSYSLYVRDGAQSMIGNYAQQQLEDSFLDYLGDDDWYGGFADYIAACGRYLEANANGTPIDVEPSDETEEEYEPLSFGDKLFFAVLMAFRFGLPLGLIVAFIVCAIYKRQLKSVRRATEAARYTVSGGAEITAREDRFTHTTEVRTPIKTESDDHDSGPSFSGGTTVNSGGFSHSGGKF